MRLNKHKNTDSEIMNYIADHMDGDIGRLMNNAPLPMGNREIPEFDEYKVYQNIIEGVQRKEKRRILPVLKWACAIALILFNISYFTYQWMDDYTPVYREVRSPKGEKVVVLLADGSRVWLNADSRLVYPEQFVGDEREVTLEGEAYFEVKKNPDNPFMVQADEMKIRVTGTSFNVSAYPSDKKIVTTLDEGKIMIGHYSTRSPMYAMSPGQTAIYEKGSSTCKITTNEFYKDASGWKENRLVFRNSPLEDVLMVLSRQFDVTFDIRGKRITTFTYNFTAKANDLGNILETMASITPIKFNEISEGMYEVK